MLKRQFSKRLVAPEDFRPLSENLTIVGAFNPAAIEHDGHIVMLVRISETCNEPKPGYLSTPIWRDGELICEWTSEAEDVGDDPRSLINKFGLARLKFVSHLRVVHLDKSGTEVQRHGAMIVPENEYEEFGLEDPRITKIGSTYYITCVTVSLHGVATSLITTEDFETFKRHGIIFPPDNKDVVLFPEKRDGRYMALHRPNPRMHFTHPEMWYSESPDLLSWGRHRWTWAPTGEWERGRIGAGAPPFRTDDGWVEIYHGSTRGTGLHKPGVYRGSVMLLSHDDPSQVIAGSKEPFMEPEEPWEVQGYVDNVVFPTAAIDSAQDDGTLLIYYGAADECCGVAAYDKAALLDTLQPISAGR